MGKAGSSSIQSTLNLNKQTLAKDGTYYLGLMLENTGDTLYEWQKPYGWPTFEKIEKQKANEQLIESFKHIESTIPSTFTKLIWSNESLLLNYDLISPTLLFLNDKYDVEIIGYIRRPDSWIASAYRQWGIMHKAYTGKLKRFKQWVKNKRFLLAPDMQKWVSTFPHIHFYNFDMIDDVALHFIQNVIAIDSTDIEIKNKNEAPCAEALALWAFYSSCFDRETHPKEFAPLLRQSGVLDSNNPIGNINSYFPKKEDIQSFLDKTAGDLEDINKILKNLDEPVIDTSEIQFTKYTVNQADVNRALLQLVAYLSNRVDTLEKKVRGESNE